jgi:DNA-binding NarL/FixJ family response regulator
MAASSPMVGSEKPLLKILILGCDLAKTIDMFSFVQFATVLSLPELHPSSLTEAQQFDPDILVCSGAVFRVFCSPSVAQSRGAVPALSSRQRELLTLLSKGLTNREIASVMGLGERVVKREVSALLAIFDASNRTELAGVVTI